MLDEMLFGVEPVVAYRAWKPLWPYFLANVNAHDIWVPGERVEARCTLRTHTEDETSPMVGCHCGLYALKAKIHESAEWSHLQHEDVIGEVYLWGKLVEHQWGWRAQYAYPKSLQVNPRLKEMIPLLSGAYGVPVTVREAVQIASAPAPVTSTRMVPLSMEDMWRVVLNPVAPMKMRRYCRTQLSVRTQTRLKQVGKSMSRVAGEYADLRVKQVMLEKHVAKLDQLLKEFKESV